MSRTSSFSPNLQLTASVKFAPFATRLRRGYIRDASERDLGTHLETALKGVIIPDRWPKSAIEVVVTVLEGEEDNPLAHAQDGHGVESVGIMNVLAGCITVASAALIDAKIDCLDLLAGGVAAVVSNQPSTSARILDPCPSEHESLLSACVVGYLPSRDELTEIWVKGDLAVISADGSVGFEELVDAAVVAARGAQLVLREAVKESCERQQQESKEDGGNEMTKNNNKMNDVEMKT